ncbi:MAG: phage major capsid protein [Candidatus Marinimicrobia bacterium]|nr:phage major capsid protein [Candidatus Neomarinimicrobiota bacterium]MCF7839788.1 phage major capsid protein [Candidatus Neomarinimicrobiota bacterium]
MPGIRAADVQAILNTTASQQFVKTFQNDSSFLGRVPLKKGKARIQWPVHHGGNASVGSFGEGDNITTTGKQARKLAELPYKRAKVAISVDGLQQAISEAGGVIGVPDLLADEILKSIEDLKANINTQLLGDGTGNTGKDITGIQAAINNSGTYAGLDRATYAWWKSHVAENGGVARNLDKPLLRAMKNELKGNRSANYSAIWTSHDIYDAYEGLLDDRKRYLTTQVGDIQQQVLSFDNTPLIPLPGYPSGRLDFVRESDFELFYLTHKTIDSTGKQVEGIFKVERLAQTTDDVAFVVIVYMQLRCRNPWKQGALLDVQ